MHRVYAEGLLLVCDCIVCAAGSMFALSLTGCWCVIVQWDCAAGSMFERRDGARGELVRSNNSDQHRCRCIASRVWRICLVFALVRTPRSFIVRADILFGSVASGVQLLPRSHRPHLSQRRICKSGAE